MVESMLPVKGSPTTRNDTPLVLTNDTSLVRTNDHARGREPAEVKDVPGSADSIDTRDEREAVVRHGHPAEEGR